MNGPRRESVRIAGQPHFLDHSFEGNTVFPAVEALALLARTVSPEVPVATMTEVSFAHFLHVPKDGSDFDAQIEIEPTADGAGRRSQLVSRFQAKTGGVAGVKRHAEATFTAAHESALPPWDVLACLEGVGFTVPASRLYAELVPFGPAYHNAHDPIVFTPDGAIGWVVANPVDAVPGPLGSPFPLDAAFHLACAWGQRYAGIVGFPVGFARRHVRRLTQPAQRYYCRVQPTGTDDKVLLFDLWIFDAAGELFEELHGIRMQDVSRGRLRAPEWVQANRDDPLHELRAACRGLAVIERPTIAPFAELVLTGREHQPFDTFGERRRQSFLSARLALKRLARRLNGAHVPNVETLDDTGTRPALPAVAGPRLFCSAAHDSRFALAVAHDAPLGVDVEPLSDKILRGARVFTQEAERTLMRQSPLGELPAAARAWTAKEAAAKAFDLPLPHVWSRATMRAIGEVRSVLRFREHDFVVRHATVDDHVVALLIADPSVRPC
jgi:4'-phosphopantetheinyl transferase EntD